jgi:hypothetical protein
MTGVVATLVPAMTRRPRDAMMRIAFYILRFTYHTLERYS